MQHISSFCCLIFLAFSSLVLAEKNHCGKHGPHIRYPFSFKNDPPNYPPAFIVSCNEKKQITLELPVQLAIKAIDYKAQRIKIYDPEDCLLNKLLKPDNLSSIFSPFHFLDNSFIDITLFNCSSAQQESSTYPLELVRCYDAHSPGYQVYWASSSSSIEDYTLLSCTKMTNYSSIPYKDGSGDFYLEWSEPKCRACEEEGMICVPKNNGISSTEIQCLRMKKRGVSVKTLGVSLGSLVLVLLAGAAYGVYYSDRKEKHNQSKIEKILDDYKALKPSRYAYADIKRITDEFKDKLGQGLQKCSPETLEMCCTSQMCTSTEWYCSRW